MLPRSIFDGTLSPKSTCAFEFSFETLARRNPKLYFWTFTPEEKVRDEVYSRWWDNFHRRLRRYILPTDFEGLRVYERWDDGFIHCHMVCNIRLPVRLVRYHAQRTGIGWMHASEITDTLATTRYCAKYLAKKFRFQSGIRHWAALGNWPYTRVKDVIFSSHPPSPLAYFLAQAKERKEKRPWQWAQLMMHLVDFGEMENPVGHVSLTAEDYG